MPKVRNQFSHYSCELKANYSLIRRLTTQGEHTLATLKKGKSTKVGQMVVTHLPNQYWEVYTYDIPICFDETPEFVPCIDLTIRQQLGISSGVPLFHRLRGIAALEKQALLASQLWATVGTNFLTTDPLHFGWATTYQNDMLRLTTQKWQEHAKQAFAPSVMATSEPAYQVAIRLYEHYKNTHSYFDQQWITEVAKQRIKHARQNHKR